MGIYYIRSVFVALLVFCSFRTSLSEDLFLRPLSTFPVSDSHSALTRSGDHLYLTAFGGLQIINVSDPTAPSLVSKTSAISYAADIAVSGSHAYLGHFAAKVTVLDISDLENPREIGSYNVPGGVLSLKVRDHLLFAADGTPGNSGLLILDISNPASPAKVSFTPTSDRPAHITISNNKAYVIAGNVLVFDISDPAAPRKIGDYRDFFPSAAQASLEGNTLYVTSGDIGLKIFDVATDQPALVAHHPQYRAAALAVQQSQFVLQLNSGEIIVLDLSDPRAPRRIAGYSGLGTPHHIVYADGHIHFFNVNDLVTVLVEPAAVRRLGEIKTSGEFRDLFSYGATHLLAANFPTGVDILNINNPAQPQLASHYPLRLPESVTVSGNTAAFTGDTTNLHLVDIANPAAPQKIGSDDFYGYWLADVALAGRHVLVANRTGHVYNPPKSLTIVDVQDPANPGELGGWDSSGATIAIVVKGHYAYLVSPTNTDLWGVSVIDFSDPANPREVNHLRTPDYGYDLAIAGDTLVVADGFGGIFIADISDPANPRRVGVHDTPGNAFHVALAPPFAYVADGVTGLLVFDISNREDPRLLGGNSAFTATRVAVAGNCIAISSGSDGALHLLNRYQSPIRLSWNRSAAGTQLTASGTPGQTFRLQTTDSLPGTWRDLHQSTFTEGDLTLPTPELGRPGAYFRIVQP